jgi:hypothetical protein
MRLLMLDGLRLSGWSGDWTKYFDKTRIALMCSDQRGDDSDT